MDNLEQVKYFKRITLLLFLSFFIRNLKEGCFFYKLFQKKFNYNSLKNQKKYLLIFSLTKIKGYFFLSQSQKQTQKALKASKQFYFFALMF